MKLPTHSYESCQKADSKRERVCQLIETWEYWDKCVAHCRTWSQALITPNIQWHVSHTKILASLDVSLYNIIYLFHITGFHTPVSKHVRTFSLQSHQVLVFKAVVLRGNFKIISPGVHTIYHGKCRSPFGHFPDSRGVLPRKILGKIHSFPSSSRCHSKNSELKP